MNFGVMYDSYVPSKDKMKNITVYDDFFWSAGMRAARFGESNKQAYYFSQTNANQVIFDENYDVYTIFDSAWNAIGISGLYFQSFIDNFFKDHNVKNYRAENATVTAQCGDTDWKSVYF